MRSISFRENLVRSVSQQNMHQILKIKRGIKLIVKITFEKQKKNREELCFRRRNGKIMIWKYNNKN